MQVDNKPKKKPLKKFFKFSGKLIKGVGAGVIDTILPNIGSAIKKKEPDTMSEKPKYDIDFVRLATAITIWILLLLVFMGKIKFSDVLEFIKLKD